MEPWIFLGVAALAVVAYVVGEKRAKAKMVDRFAGRGTLEFDAFYDRFYKGSLDKNLVKELLDHVARELSVPSTKLRPEDSFERELKPERGWEFDSGRNMLFVELGKLANAKGSQIDLATIRTLDDYIKAMARIY